MKAPNVIVLESTVYERYDRLKHRAIPRAIPLCQIRLRIFEFAFLMYPSPYVHQTQQPRVDGYVPRQAGAYPVGGYAQPAPMAPTPAYGTIPMAAPSAPMMRPVPVVVAPTVVPTVAPMMGAPMMAAPMGGGYYGQQRAYKFQKKMMKRSRKAQKHRMKYGGYGHAGGLGAYGSAPSMHSYHAHKAHRRRMKGRRNVQKGIFSLNPKKVAKGLGQQHSHHHRHRRYY